MYKRYDDDLVDKIYDNIDKFNNASELANAIGIDVSGLIKHIKKYRRLIYTENYNRCGHKKTCEIKNLCIVCGNKTYNNKCKSCKVKPCNRLCSLYTPIPDCKRVKKYPYVCNGCKDRQVCRNNIFLYDSRYVKEKIVTTRSESRKGVHADEEELMRLSKLLVPLIKDKHQSLPQIFLTHKEEIRYSYPTILYYIDNRLIPGLTNGDLTKRVRYPVSYKKHTNEPTNKAFITNRTYDDFVNYISENPHVDVVEMDTVLSSIGSNYCLLTMLFRKSNFMLAFLLKEKTVNEVKRIYDFILDKLGEELFTLTFNCILTDNGSEFADPRVIEFSYETGVKLVNLFYCDPGKSGQKGKIEKNHVELRKIFPKGTDFSKYTQSQINVALSHINSEPRGILNRHAPGTIARLFLNEKVLDLNEYQFIEPDSVLLSPTLLK